MAKSVSLLQSGSPQVAHHQPQSFGLAFLLSPLCPVVTHHMKSSLGKCLQCAQRYVMVNAPTLPGSCRQSFTCCLTPSATASTCSMCLVRRNLDHAIIPGYSGTVSSLTPCTATAGSFQLTSSFNTMVLSRRFLSSLLASFLPHCCTTSRSWHTYLPVPVMYCRHIIW